MYTEKGGEESSNSDCSQILGCEVPVQSLELVEGQHDAQEIDQDPEGIENVVTIWTLMIDKVLEYDSLKQNRFSPVQEDKKVDEYDHQHWQLELHSEMWVQGLL